MGSSGRGSSLASRSLPMRLTSLAASSNAATTDCRIGQSIWGLQVTDCTRRDWTWGDIEIGYGMVHRGWVGVRIDELVSLTCAHKRCDVHLSLMGWGLSPFEKQARIWIEWNLVGWSVIFQSMSQWSGVVDLSIKLKMRHSHGLMRSSVHSGRKACRRAHGR